MNPQAIALFYKELHYYDYYMYTHFISKFSFRKYNVINKKKLCLNYVIKNINLNVPFIQNSKVK